MFFYHFSTIPIWHKRIASILLSSHCHFVGKLISQRHLTVIEKMTVHIACHGDVSVSEPLLNDVREIIRTLCKYKKVEIIDGAVCADYVHLCLSIPPKHSIAEFMGYLKGKSALMVFDRHPELGSKWDRSFWARGYDVSTIENVDEETMRKYIREQEEESYKGARATK